MCPYISPPEIKREGGVVSLPLTQHEVVKLGQVFAGVLNHLDLQQVYQPCHLWRRGRKREATLLIEVYTISVLIRQTQYLYATIISHVKYNRHGRLCEPPSCLKGGLSSRGMLHELSHHHDCHVIRLMVT